ncbi:MAG: hypothetical protein RIG68_25880 [Imperialibacter sp.]|uniref:hypothetical protein n=1 Tax=Imperialibacter sp. TaxID=2038411 RepID=UPI0032ED21FC
MQTSVAVGGSFGRAWLKPFGKKKCLAAYSSSGVNSREISKAAEKQKMLLTNDSKEVFEVLGF